MKLSKEEFIDICKIKSEEELWEWVKEYAYNLMYCNQLNTDKER